jgi:hypothetical protein
MSRRLGVTYLLGATLLVSGCKSKSQEAAPAPAPATPSAGAPAKPAEPAPVTDGTLSFIEAAGDTCNWVRLEAPSGTRKNVFTFDGPCVGTQLSWSQDGRKGSVLQSYGGARPSRAWTVDLVTGQGQALPLPDVGFTAGLGFDPQGRPVALVAHYEQPDIKAPERVEEGGQEAFVFEGQKYPIDPHQDGSAGLAHAYRREGEAWKRVETKASSFDGDAAEETSGLEALKQLGPTSATAAQQVRSEEVTEEQAAALEKAAPVRPAAEEAEGGTNPWARFNTPGGPLYHRLQVVEREIPVLPLRWEVGGALAEPEKLALPEGTAITLETRGDVLLIAADNSAVRVYDAKQKKHLLSLEEAFRPSFWPRPKTN